MSRIGLLCTLAVVCMGAGPAEQHLDPVWSWRLSAGVEWAEAIGGADSPMVLVATRAAQLHLIDARTGQRVWATPVAARQGVRLAACDEAFGTDVAYCFDRFCVYALGRDGLRWRAGAWREDLTKSTDVRRDAERMFQGDPEELLRIIAVSATEWGALVVRDDGRMALLDRSDGHVCWQLRFAALSMARLHVCGRTAALVWKEGARVVGAFVDVREGTRRAVALPADGGWPLWTTLTARGLVVVRPHVIELYEVGGARRVLYANDATSALAAAVLLDGGGAASPRLVFGSMDGCLRMLRVADKTGDVWIARDQPAGAAHWSLLRVRGDKLLAGTDDALSIRDADTGELRWHAAGKAREELVDADVAQGALWLLWRVESGDAERWSLGRLDWSGGGDERRCELEAEGALLRVIWTRDRLILVTRAGLWAYALH